MYRKHLAILLSISMLLFLLSTPVSGQQVTRLQPGQYAENGDLIVFFSPIPLTKSPETSYGKRGNPQTEKVLEDVALAAYELLKNIKNAKGWPALRTVVIEFDRITLEKYKWTNYENVMSEITKAFNLTNLETQSD